MVIYIAMAVVALLVICGMLYSAKVKYDVAKYLDGYSRRDE